MYENIIKQMKEIFSAAPYGIKHTMRVLGYAEEIMDGENILMEQRQLIAVVAILHDIGAIEAQKKHGSMEGKFQEKEGPIIARCILEKFKYSPAFVERTCYIIGNHHTPSKIDGIDFQIQWEADLIDNLKYTDTGMDRDRLVNYIDNNFKTGTGKKIAYREILGE